MVAEHRSKGEQPGVSGAVDDRPTGRRWNRQGQRLHPTGGARAGGEATGEEQSILGNGIDVWGQPTGIGEGAEEVDAQTLDGQLDDVERSYRAGVFDPVDKIPRVAGSEIPVLAPGETPGPEQGPPLVRGPVERAVVELHGTERGEEGKDAILGNLAVVVVIELRNIGLADERHRHERRHEEDRRHDQTPGERSLRSQPRIDPPSPPKQPPCPGRQEGQTRENRRQWVGLPDVPDNFVGIDEIVHRNEIEPDAEFVPENPLGRHDEGGEEKPKPGRHHHQDPVRPRFEEPLGNDRQPQDDRDRAQKRRQQIEGGPEQEGVTEAEIKTEDLLCLRCQGDSRHQREQKKDDDEDHHSTETIG